MHTYLSGRGGSHRHPPGEPRAVLLGRVPGMSYCNAYSLGAPIYMCVREFVCIYIYIFAYICIHTYMCTTMHICMYKCIYTYIAYKQTNVQKCVNTFTGTPNGRLV